MSGKEKEAPKETPVMGFQRASGPLAEFEAGPQSHLKLIDRFPLGVVTPPPSKSLSHRAAICAALAGLTGDESVIENFGRSEDIDTTVVGMGTLFGTNFLTEGDAIRVTALSNGAKDAQIKTQRSGAHSVATRSLLRKTSGPLTLPDRRFSAARPPTGFRASLESQTREIDCGESGSTLRFLIPLAALTGGRTVFRGRGRLLQRPLDVYASIFSLSEHGVCFTQGPDEVMVEGTLRSGLYALPGNVSSQFVSGLLMALPMAEGDSEIALTTPLESRQYVDLTLSIMKRFGVEVEEVKTGRNARFLVRGSRRFLPAWYRVEADYSQAAFFLAASALGRNVRTAGLDPESEQGDRALLRVLRDMGAEVIWDGEGKEVSIRAGRLRAVVFDARETPDLVPPVAVLCCFCDGTSKIVGAERLRLKESDRLRALATELRKLGAEIAERPDTLVITGADRLHGGEVDAWGDHRIAMSLAVAAIRCDGPVTLKGWQSVSKSYPDFWRDFEKVKRG